MLGAYAGVGRSKRRRLIQPRRSDQRDQTNVMRQTLSYSEHNSMKRTVALEHFSLQSSPALGSGQMTPRGSLGVDASQASGLQMSSFRDAAWTCRDYVYTEVSVYTRGPGM